MSLLPRNFLLLPLALLLAGCVNFGLAGEDDPRALAYYVLEDVGRPAPPASPAPRTLLLADTTAGAFYDSDGMAFSGSPGTRGYYQYARWSERPGKRFTDLLLMRLDREKVVAAVAQSGSNVRSDLLLLTDIVEFYHDAAQSPGTVRMELRAEVVDLKTRKLLDRKTFVQSIGVSTFDAAGAHKAFNEAATRTLGEVADWLKELASRG